MADRLPLVLKNGKIEQLQADDSLLVGEYALPNTDYIPPIPPGTGTPVLKWDTTESLPVWGPVSTLPDIESGVDLPGYALRIMDDPFGADDPVWLPMGNSLTSTYMVYVGADGELTGTSKLAHNGTDFTLAAGSSLIGTDYTANTLLYANATKGITATTATYAAATGTIIASALGSIYYVEKSSYVLFTDTANEKADLYFSAPASGRLEITVIGGYTGANYFGSFTKVISGMWLAGGTALTVNSYITDVLGNVGNGVTIADPTWDATNSRWRMQIVHRTSIRVPVRIHIRFVAADTTSRDAIAAVGISSIYTTDATVFPAPVPTFTGTLITDGTSTNTCYVNASHELDFTDKLAFDGTHFTLATGSALKSGDILYLCPATAKAVQMRTTGNARGAGAFDFQTDATSAAEVASGGNSVCIGARNTASGSSAIAIGYNCDATNTYSVALAASVASGQGAFAAGYLTTAAGTYSMATARSGLANMYGQFARGAHQSAAVGDRQTSSLCAWRNTTNATQTEIFLCGQNGATESCLIVPENSIWGFTISMTARETNNDYSTARWIIEGTIARETGGNVAIKNQSTTYSYEDDANWAFDVDAYTTGQRLRLRVTGAADNNISWLARIELEQITG
jgi:hypothetical protein